MQRDSFCFSTHPYAHTHTMACCVQLLKTVGWLRELKLWCCRFKKFVIFWVHRLKNKCKIVLSLWLTFIFFRWDRWLVDTENCLASKHSYNVIVFIYFVYTNVIIFIFFSLARALFVLSLNRIQIGIRIEAQQQVITYFQLDSIIKILRITSIEMMFKRCDTDCFQMRCTFISVKIQRLNCN